MNRLSISAFFNNDFGDKEVEFEIDPNSIDILIHALSVSVGKWVINLATVEEQELMLQRLKEIKNEINLY